MPHGMKILHFRWPYIHASNSALFLQSTLHSNLILDKSSLNTLKDLLYSRNETEMKGALNLGCKTSRTLVLRTLKIRLQNDGSVNVFKSSYFRIWWELKSRYNNSEGT